MVAESFFGIAHAFFLNVLSFCCGGNGSLFSSDLAPIVHFPHSDLLVYCLCVRIAEPSFWAAEWPTAKRGDTWLSAKMLSALLQPKRKHLPVARPKFSLGPSTLASSPAPLSPQKLRTHKPDRNYEAINQTRGYEGDQDYGGEDEQYHDNSDEDDEDDEDGGDGLTPLLPIFSASHLGMNSVMSLP